VENKQNSSTEIIPSTPIYPDLHQIKHLDPIHSIETILVALTLINGIKNLFKSIGRLRKQGKLNYKLLLQIVGSVLAIWKAIALIFK
jgi:hypothetical protein